MLFIAISRVFRENDSDGWRKQGGSRNMYSSRWYSSVSLLHHIYRNFLQPYSNFYFQSV